MDVFRQHFKIILNQDRSVDRVFVSEKLEQRPVAKVLDQPITRKEVEEAVKSLQNAKTPGETVFLLRYGRSGGRLLTIQ